MKSLGGREAGYFSKMVKDCGNQRLFDFECRCRVFQKYFRFLFVKSTKLTFAFFYGEYEAK